LAVTIAAVFGGFRAGSLTLVLSAVAGWIVFAEPQLAAAPMSAADTTDLVIFLVSAGLVGVIAASLRHAILQLRRDLQLSLIADELQHRVKNVLALVQSLSGAIARTAPDMPAFQAAFEARLAALANAHDVLARSRRADADLRELIGAHVDAFVSCEGPRLRLDGEEVSVAPGAAVMLSLVLHELTTNAVKYGCLSTAGGELRLTWRSDSRREKLTLDWLERGGPKVEPPRRKGFGTTLLARTLGSDGRIDFDPDGLHVVATFPLPARSGAVAPQGASLLWGRLGKDPHERNAEPLDSPRTRRARPVDHDRRPRVE
jgi:two-component sensor histidine kinase